MQCQIHPDQYVLPGKDCPRCNKALWEADHERKKTERLALSRKYNFHKFYTPKPVNAEGKPIKTKADYRKGLKVKLQSEWRKLMYEYYSKIEYNLDGYKCTLADFCWIERKRFFNPEGVRKHIMSVAHISHYYPKGEHYLMWTCPVNSGVLNHNQNVNKQGNVIAMEPMMLYVWGEQRVKEMKELAEYNKDQMRRGLVRSSPSNEWLLAEIEKVKTMVIR